MKSISPKFLAAIVVVVILVAIVITTILVSLPERNTAGLLDNGLYEDYYILCEKTDETIKETEIDGGATTTYEWTVYRCTATAPGESTPYELDLELTRGPRLYLHWIGCDQQGLKMQGNFVVDNTEYDIVLEDTLSCVSMETSAL